MTITISSLGSKETGLLNQWQDPMISTRQQRAVGIVSG